MTSTKRESFEELYTRLEQHVGRLEQGGLPLEDAIALYEEGMKLARACQQRLEEAELKISKLQESFAATQERANGAAVRDADGEYEYAPTGEQASADADV